MAKQGKKYDPAKYDRCPIGRDPEVCDIRRGCTHWSISLDCCTYHEEKEQQRKQRSEEGFAGSDVIVLPSNFCVLREKNYALCK